MVGQGLPEQYMVGQFKLMAHSWMSSGLYAVLLGEAGMWLGTGLSFGAEVSGVYTEPTTKDLGEITKIDLFKRLKFRGWINVYSTQCAGMWHIGEPRCRLETS
jgi:hypothetical protein